MSEELSGVNCISCGIYFGLPIPLRELWKKADKYFCCPNGHQIRLIKDDEPYQELESLKLKVKDLEEKLKEKTDKVEELESELEIWRPRSKEN